MKKVISLIISLFISITVLIPQMTVPVNAGKDAGTIDGTFTETAESKNWRYEQDESHKRKPSAQTQSVQDIVTQSDILYTRSQMKKRKPDVVLHKSYDPDYYDVPDYLVEKAIEHTGVPTEGDYLAFQYGGWSCSYSYDYSTMDIELQLTYYTDAVQEKKVDSAIKKILDELYVYNCTDYLKIKEVYDWIADHVSYDMTYGADGSDLIYTAYGAIVNREAVCQGYAVLFYRMMLELGIDCRVIAGIGNGGPHAWNIVRLNGKYYNIDVTWASTTYDHEEYFLRGSNYFYDHSADAEYRTADFTKKYPIDRNDYVVTDADTDEGGLFRDVRDPSKYYFGPVYWAVENGITVGYGGYNKFSPNESCTREQIVTFLHRLMNEPEPHTYSYFTDVNESDWYYKPITWAYENGITTGLNDGTGRFGVGQPCTREQCVTFLYRAAGEPEVTEHIEFTDVTEDRYFYDAISWAASRGITVGLNDGTGRFGVGQKCTRAMIVTFLYRYANQ